MSDAPGPWRRIGREHHQQCGDCAARVYRHAPYVYRWRAYRLSGPSDFTETGAAHTLIGAKRAATAALIRHAPMPF